MSFGDQLKRSISQVIPGIASEQNGKKAPARLSHFAEQEITNLRETNLELLETLGAVVDSLSPHTLYHSTQVAIYALEIARRMDLPVEDQERIFKAGLVHDVGMISLSSAAIAKDKKLSDLEYESLRLHPTISGEIVGRIQHLRELAPLVHYHHERYDGAGYPDRLVGEEIPLGARILCLADSLDAMLTERPGRPGRSLEEVTAEIIRCSGAQFDPLVVQAFVLLARERGPELFSCSNTNASHDMLLTTVGISSGRASKALNNP